MRKTLIMSEEYVKALESNPVADRTALAEVFFQEILTDLDELRACRPSTEQVPAIFREIDDRWVNFCRKAEPEVLNPGAFMAWANGHPVRLVQGGPLCVY